MLLLPPTPEGSLGAGFGYASLAVGSLLALFLYPHSLTGLLSSASSMAIRRNAILAAHLFAGAGPPGAAGLHGGYRRGSKICRNMPPALPISATTSPSPRCSCTCSRRGSLVSPSPPSPSARWCRPRSWRSPAANLFTRNIYKEFISPGCTPGQEASAAKLASFALKLGALFFVLLFQTSYAIQLQLLGGIWVCQTLPAVLIALYTRFFKSLGIAGGMGCGYRSRHGDGVGAQVSKARSIRCTYLG